MRERGKEFRMRDGVNRIEQKRIDISGLTSDTRMVEWLEMPVRSASEVKMSLIPSLGRTSSS